MAIISGQIKILKTRKWEIVPKMVKISPKITKLMTYIMCIHEIRVLWTRKDLTASYTNGTINKR